MMLLKGRDRYRNRTGSCEMHVGLLDSNKLDENYRSMRLGGTHISRVKYRMGEDLLKRGKDRHKTNAVVTPYTIRLASPGQ